MGELTALARERAQRYPDCKPHYHDCERDHLRCLLLMLADRIDDLDKDAWRYRVMVENGVVPSEWHEIISQGRDGYRVRADAAFDQFVTDEPGGVTT